MRYYETHVPFILQDGTMVPPGTRMELEDDVAALHAGLISPVAPPAAPPPEPAQ